MINTTAEILKGKTIVNIYYNGYSCCFECSDGEIIRCFSNEDDEPYFEISKLES